MKPFHDKHFLLEILYFGNSIIEIVLVKKHRHNIFKRALFSLFTSLSVLILTKPELFSNHRIWNPYHKVNSITKDLKANIKAIICLPDICSI